MKEILLSFLMLIFFVANVYSQSEGDYLMDGVNISENTKLIGMYAYYDTTKTYEEFNFIIENKVVLDSLSKALKYGKLENKIGEENGMRFYLLEGDSIVKSWLMSPRYSNLLENGNCYNFELSNIFGLIRKYHFKYDVVKIGFASESEFDNYQKEIRSDSLYLFLYEPSFDFEGSFDLEFNADSGFSSLKLISDYLKPKLNRIARKDKYSISYVLNEYNMNNRDQISMTIKTSYKKYKKFKAKNSIKKKWVPAKYEAIIFKRRKEK